MPHHVLVSQKFNNELFYWDPNYETAWWLHCAWLVGFGEGVSLTIPSSALVTCA